MKLITFLRDGRRSQRGSVLSGVLIMTAFVAIISGALMTELSTNFLLSDVLINRVQYQATINSATELAISRLQSTPISAGCPALTSATLNGTTATVSYLGCKPVVDSRSPQFLQIESNAFTVDGTHSGVARAGINVYVAADSSGNVYQFNYGSASPVWSMQVAGTVSGPPVTVPDFSESTVDVANLVPLAATSNSPQPCQAGGCVARLSQLAGQQPDGLCYMAAHGPVKSAAAIGVNNPTVAFYGDQTGALFAADLSESGTCAQLMTASAGQPVVAGPLVFGGPVTGSSRADELYFVTAGPSSSFLRQYEFVIKSGVPVELEPINAWQLTASNAVGVTADATTLPARLAIDFAGGQVEVVQIQSGSAPQKLATAQLPPTVSAGPQWCRCPGGDQIAVAGMDGSLYLLSPSLGVIGSLAATGVAIATRPTTDAVGDWYFGGVDGYVREVQRPAGQSQLAVVASYGPLGGAIGGAAVAGACPAGICLYAGSPGGAYLIQLDARDAVLNACVATAPSACSATNPRLWASVEVGAGGSPRTVHVDGWSYYSG